MMLATRIIHIYRAFLYTTFQRILAILQLDGRVSIDDISILLFNVVSRMLRTGFIDDYYEHIPLNKSGEDNQ